MQYIAAGGWCAVVAVVLVAAANRSPIIVVAGALISAPAFGGATLAFGIDDTALVLAAWLAVVVICNWLAAGRSEATVQNLTATVQYRSAARRAVRRRVVVMNTGGIK